MRTRTSEPRRAPLRRRLSRVSIMQLIRWGFCNGTAPLSTTACYVRIFAGAIGRLAAVGSSQLYLPRLSVSDETLSKSPTHICTVNGWPVSGSIRSDPPTSSLSQTRPVPARVCVPDAPAVANRRLCLAAAGRTGPAAGRHVFRGNQRISRPGDCQGVKSRRSKMWRKWKCLEPDPTRSGWKAFLEPGRPVKTKN